MGLLVVWLARKAPHAKWTELRLAVANIHRPGAVTYAVVLSLGLGLALLVTLTMIDRNIRNQLQEGLPGQTPSFFFVDVPSRQADEFEAFVKKNASDATIDRVPFIRGRLVRVNETPAEQVNAKENAAWVLEGDRGITYSAAVPAGSTLAQGDWWAPIIPGPPLVSMEADVAAGIGVGIGDSVTLNVMGRNITAKVANLRRVNWRSMGINFVFVFSPNTFAGAPHMFLATAAFPDGGSTERELALLQQVAQTFPTVTTIRVKDTLEAVARITDQLAFAIRGATSIALLAAILVLAGAIAAGQRARIYDAVVLKTLGATRWRLMQAYLIEYGLLGLATAIFGVLAGAIAASVIVTRVMRLDHFVWDWSSAGQAAAIALGDHIDPRSASEPGACLVRNLHGGSVIFSLPIVHLRINTPAITTSLTLLAIRALTALVRATSAGHIIHDRRPNHPDRLKGVLLAQADVRKTCPILTATRLPAGEPLA